MSCYHKCSPRRQVRDTEEGRVAYAQSGFSDVRLVLAYLVVPSERFVTTVPFLMMT